MKTKKSIKLAEIYEIEVLKDRVSKLYDELDAKVLKLFKKYGETEESYALPENKEGHRVIRIRLIDNVKKLQEGAVYRTTSIKPVEAEIKRLKVAA